MGGGSASKFSPSRVVGRVDANCHSYLLTSIPQKPDCSIGGTSLRSITALTTSVLAISERVKGSLQFRDEFGGRYSQ